MDLAQLRYFQTVARLEHMTRAAEELAIAQPSLSQAIARLEDELGIPLFDRVGRQIKLNQFGRTFLKQVEQAFTCLADGQREIADLAGLEQGSIAIAIISTQILPEMLKLFLADHPNVHFRLFQQHSAQMVRKMLERGEIDLCITSPRIEDADIHWTPLITEEIFLAVPREHPLAGRQSIRLLEVAQESFISLRPGSTMRGTAEYFCQQAGFRPKVTFEGDEPSTIQGLVSAGLGVAFMPALSWRQASEATMVRLHISDPICQRTIGLSWHEHHYLSQAAGQFREFVINYFTQLQQRLITIQPTTTG